MFPFCILRKHPKTKDFLVFSGYMKWKYRLEMGKHDFILKKELATSPLQIAVG